MSTIALLGGARSSDIDAKEIWHLWRDFGERYPHLSKAAASEQCPEAVRAALADGLPAIADRFIQTGKRLQCAAECVDPETALVYLRDAITALRAELEHLDAEVAAASVN